ncbi:hypothetical protein V1264_017033 [Littorina saxatilis]|uniref:Uncharacterized protein n=1 Tax=Littorina saxatilis TaxID=31220 RepID=A0AAN9BGD9_9CAEN
MSASRNVLLVGLLICFLCVVTTTLAQPTSLSSLVKRVMDTDPAPRNRKDLNENDRLTSHVTDDQKRHSFSPDPFAFTASRG